MEEKKRVEYMRRALALAAKAAGWVASNPRVGAVIVKGERIIGEGYHRRFGEDHAEIEALKDCQRQGNNPAGAVMFVTLEPCCHFGKTGPCTEAIIGAKIAEVEIATLDEFEEVAGKGSTQLTERGIKVRVGCCEHQARQLNAGYFKLQMKQQPQVILKWAQSIDGRLTWPEGTRQRWITGEKARRHVHQVRNECGMVLVGIGTVLADDPLLTVRLEGEHYKPTRVVLDSQLRIPVESNLVRTAREISLVVYTLTPAMGREVKKLGALLDRGCKVLPVAEHEGRVKLSAVLADLGKRGVTDLLVEGGATVLKSFWEAGLADKVVVYIAPVIIGGEAGARVTNFAEKVEKLEDVSIKQFDGDVCIEGYVGDLGIGRPG